MNEKRFVELWERLRITCYGTGESEILESFKKLFNANFTKMEGYESFEYAYDVYNELKIVETWLLINALNNARFIEYGTSIRFGMTTEIGYEFMQLVKNNEVEQLYEAIMNEENYRDLEC